jgi:hypothetical protein
VADTVQSLLRKLFFPFFMYAIEAHHFSPKKHFSAILFYFPIERLLAMNVSSG